MSDTNRQLVLRSRPKGAVTDDCFELVQAPITEPQAGQVLLRTLWLSFDPAQRGCINDVRSYVPPVAIGEVMRARVVAEVLASRDPAFPVGSLVAGIVSWQTHTEFETGHGTAP